MTVKFITVKGSDRLAREPIYMGLVQHDRTMSSRPPSERRRGVIPCARTQSIPR